MKRKINYNLIKILSLIIIGILAIITKEKYINLFHIAIYLGMFVYGLKEIIVSLKKSNYDVFNLFFVLLNLFLIIIIAIKPQLYTRILPMVIGIYILIIGVAELVSLFIYRELPKSRINILIHCIIHFIFSIILFVNPTTNIKSITFIIGIYLILLGISYIPSTKKNNDLKIVKIPIIIQSLKPYSDFLKIDFDHYNQEKQNIEVDIEVLIHVRKNKRGVFGHSDLIYNNKVYSYGNYDVNSYKLMDAIGDGLLIEATKDDYIKYCKSYGKTLFSFGIKLNEDEKEEVEKRFQKIMQNTYTFDKQKVAKNSYIDKLNQNANVNFYKFKNGYYKNYFFLNYNCVKFIEEVISPENLNFTTIKTPGTLYTTLEETYQSRNGKVIRKIIY